MKSFFLLPEDIMRYIVTYIVDIEDVKNMRLTSKNLKIYFTIQNFVSGKRFYYHFLNINKKLQRNYTYHYRMIYDYMTTNLPNHGYLSNRNRYNGLYIEIATQVLTSDTPIFIHYLKYVSRYIDKFYVFRENLVPIETFAKQRLEALAI